MDNYSPFTSLGWILIILGALFVALPHLVRIFPSLDRVPWWILWVYKRDGFYFATSPLLIIISILSVLLNYLQR